MKSVILKKILLMQIRHKFGHRKHNLYLHLMIYYSIYFHKAENVLLAFIEGSNITKLV